LHIIFTLEEEKGSLGLITKGSGSWVLFSLDLPFDGFEYELGVRAQLFLAAQAHSKGHPFVDAAAKARQ
jgi:hypothetical protein